MSKVLRTIAKVATVVAAVAAIGTGIGAVMGGTMMLTGVASAATIASVSSAIAGVASALAQATAKKPPAAGTSNQFTIDPQAGIPYCIGRTFAGGRIVHVDGYGGAENPYRSYVIAFSGGGPSDSIESVLIDRSPVSVGAGGASGYYSDFMWLSTQLGAAPEASALAAPFAGFPGWGSAHKLSGYAAGLWTLKFDKKGKKFASGQPEFGVVGKWVKVYDPRLDSTFPGGSGPCRVLQENTYVWSQNGPLHALTWALGRWQNSKRALGVGIEAQDIDLQAFVDAANVFDANGWAVGGVMDGSGDKWNTLRTILWAGAAEPLDLGGLLSCRYESPKVSLATITGDDLAAGDIVVPAMKTWRDRINSIIPRYRSEAHNWEIIPASAVRGTTYIAEDGEERTRESEYYCCQSLTQAAQLAAYEIALSREIDGISIPLKTKFIGYKPGDCLTLNIPEANLNNQPAVVTNRTLDPVTGIVTMTFRTETAAKHAWALGRTSSAPPSPSITSSAVMDALIWNNRAGIPEERYNPLSTYDFGRIVNLANGARYIYIHSVASAGNAPPNATYWSELSASPSVDVAQSIVGQGALATQNGANYSSQVYGLPVAIQPGNILSGGNLNAGFAQYGPGGPLVSSLQPAEAGANVTANWTAAAISGQGALATANSAAYSTQISGLPTPIQPSNLVHGGMLDFYFIRDYSNVRLDQRWPAELGANVTANWTAAGIAGQGPAATAPANAAMNSYIGVDANGNFVNAVGSGHGTNISNVLVANKLTNIGSTNVVIEGNTIRREGGSDYNACVRGEPIAGACFAEVLMPLYGYAMVSLDTEPTGVTYDQQRITVHAIANSGWAVYQDGAAIWSGGGAPPAGQTVRLIYDGGRYQLHFNGQQAGPDFAARPGLTHYAKFNNYNGPDIRISGVNYGPYAQVSAETKFIVSTASGPTLRLIGANAIKRDGAGSWDSQCYSETGFTGGAYCSFSPTESSCYFMAGLNSDPTADAGYASLDYAFYMGASTDIRIYEGGGAVSTPGGSTAFGIWSAGTVLSVIYDDEHVRYLINGDEVRCVRTASGRKFHFDSSVVQGGAITNLRFGPVTPDAASVDFIHASDHQSQRGNSVYKNIRASEGWNTKSVSRQAQTGAAFVSGKLATPGTFFGLHRLGDSSVSYTSMEASFHRSSNGSWYVWSYSGSRINLGAAYNGVTFTADTEFRIDYDATTIKWFADNVLMDTMSAAADRTYQAAVAVYYPGDRVSNIQFGAYSDNDWGSVAGPNRPHDNADVTANNVAAAVAGQGALATRNTARVGAEIVDQWGSYLPPEFLLNNREAGGMTSVAVPVGGTWSYDGYTAGAFQITLPPAIAASVYAMVRFIVDVFDFSIDGGASYEVSGYLYPADQTWYNCAARAIGSTSPQSIRAVRFGRTGAGGSGKFCIWIGDAASAAYYPKVRVRDVMVGYAGRALSIWQEGWAITGGVTSFGPVDAVVANPTAAEAVFGVNARESWGGSVATLANFKTGIGTAAAIAGQGAGATANTLAQLDAAAAAQLTSAVNGGAVSVGINEVRTVLMNAGASIAYEAMLLVEAGGTGGNVQLRVDWAPGGTGSWSTVATHTGNYAGPGEPGDCQGSGSWTNSTGLKQRIDFRLVRVNPSVGGATRTGPSRLTI